MNGRLARMELSAMRLDEADYSRWTAAEKKRFWRIMTANEGWIRRGRVHVEVVETQREVVWDSHVCMKPKLSNCHYRSELCWQWTSLSFTVACDKGQRASLPASAGKAYSRNRQRSTYPLSAEHEQSRQRTRNAYPLLAEREQLRQWTTNAYSLPAEREQLRQ